MQGSESIKSKTLKKSKTSTAHSLAAHSKPITAHGQEITMKKFAFRGLLAAVLLVTLAACGGGGGSPEPEKIAEVKCTSVQLTIDYIGVDGVSKRSCHDKPSRSTVANAVWGWQLQYPLVLTEADMPANEYDLSTQTLTLPGAGVDEQALGRKAVLVIQHMDPDALWILLRDSKTKKYYLKKVSSKSRRSFEENTPSMDNGSDLGVKSFVKLEMLTDGRFKLSLTGGGCRLMTPRIEGPFSIEFTMISQTGTCQ
jgi:predicted small lipoprotein YifL